MKSPRGTASFLDRVCSDVITKAKLIEACSQAVFWECMDWHFVLSSLTYLELIFTYDMRYGPKFIIILYMNIQSVTY